MDVTKQDFFCKTLIGVFRRKPFCETFQARLGVDLKFSVLKSKSYVARAIAMSPSVKLFPCADKFISGSAIDRQLHPLRGSAFPRLKLYRPRKQAFQIFCIAKSIHNFTMRLSG